MTRFGNHTIASACKRTYHLIRGFGIRKTLGVWGAMVDDQYLKSFDRKYKVRTSGFISLASTSFDRSKLSGATSYGPVNGWAFRAILNSLRLPKTFHFVDLGCGLARPCILAAEYGFAKVTGVELAPELCTVARENVVSCVLPGSCKARIHIIEGDVLNYCDDTDDDVFFVYRPFSPQLFRSVCGKLTARAEEQKKPIIIIHTERLNPLPTHEVQTFAEFPAFRKIYQHNMLGQSFFVYQYQLQASESIAAVSATNASYAGSERNVLSMSRTSFVSNAAESTGRDR